MGPGGTGGWTNIQAYLNANQGDTGSSQLLNKTVGDQFGQERQNFQGDSSKFLTDAQSKADANKISNDQANDLTGQAASAYNYDAQTANGQAPSLTLGQGQNDAYKGVVDKFQHALNDKYSGPTAYDYAFSAPTTQYASDLKDNPSFDTLMQGIYSKASGNPLTSGQYDLQKQFDVNNQALGDTRNSLNDQYNQLSTDRDKTVSDTTAGLGNIEQSYRDNQNSLHDYLANQSNAYSTKEAQDENAARAAYQNTFGTDKTGLSSVGYDVINGNNMDKARGVRQGIDAWGPDLTWKQLQHEQSNRMYNFGTGGPQPLWVDSEPEFNNRGGTLQNFYNNQEKQYADTGDSNKRAYNALQDFLGTNADRQKMGFDVGAPYKASLFPGMKVGR